MRRELSIFRRFFTALRWRLGGRGWLWGRVCKRSLFLFPRAALAGWFFTSSVGLTPAREAWPRKEAAESHLRRLLCGKNPTARDPARLGLFILGSRSAQRGPFTFISRRKIDTRPLRPVTSKKLRKSTRRRLRTASNRAAALGWRAAPARETLPRLRAMPHGRRGPLTGCVHTKTAGRSFGRTALRVGPPAELCSTDRPPSSSTRGYGDET